MAFGMICQKLIVMSVNIIRGEVWVNMHLSLQLEKERG